MYKIYFPPTNGIDKNSFITEYSTSLEAKMMGCWLVVNYDVPYIRIRNEPTVLGRNNGVFLIENYHYI